MNPNESVKQKLERYQRTQELTNQIRFSQASKPYSKEGEQLTAQGKTSRLIQAQTAIDRNDMEFIRSYIRTLGELDPANPYYTNLLKRDFIPWDEFREIVNNFSANHTYMVRMQDEINNLRLAASREEELTEEAPATGQETEGTVASQPEEKEPEPTPPSQDQSSDNQIQQRQAPPRQAPPRIIRQEPQLTERERRLKEQRGAPPQRERTFTPAPENETRQQRLERLRRGGGDSRKRKTVRDSSDENEEEKKKKGLRKPRENQATGKTPLGDKLNNWLKNKFNNSRLGKAFNNSRFGRALNNFNNLGNKLTSRFANTNLGRGLTKINNLLNAPSRFLNNLAGRLGNWAGSALRSLGSQALRGAFQLGSQAARFLANSAARTLSGFGSQAAGGVARTAVGVVGRGALLILANPISWIILGTVIVLFLFVWWFSDAYGECGQPGVVEMTKSANKEAVSVDENIEFKIDVVYKIKCPRAYASATVRDQIPANTTYLTGSAKALVPILGGLGGFSAQMSEGKLDGNTLVWQLNDIAPNEVNSLIFSVTPTQDNIWISNQATIGYQEYNGGLPSIAGGGFPPNQDNCGGKYSLADSFGTKNPLGNFGDSGCTLTQDKLMAMLKQLDPAEAEYWFNVVVAEETGHSYDPNSWADPVRVGTPDAAGAWGLFQMGRGKNGQLDHGDVDWQLQISNAINYNNILAAGGRAWCYWQPAYTRWAPICKTKP